MKDRAAPVEFLMQVSAVASFGLEIQMCHGRFKDSASGSRDDAKKEMFLQ